MRILPAIIIATVFLASCTEKQNTENKDSEALEVGALSVETEVSFIGEAFETEQMMAVSELQNKVTEADSAIVVAGGKVMEVCQAKGCWMTMELADGKSMRVTFKDYAFFMPKDLAGREVIMKGLASYTTTDVATLKHLAADGGKTPEEVALITEPEHALTFLASGVTIVE
jgi:hypothetical protein